MDSILLKQKKKERTQTRLPKSFFVKEFHKILGCLQEIIKKTNIRKQQQKGQRTHDINLSMFMGYKSKQAHKHASSTKKIEYENYIFCQGY